MVTTWPDKSDLSPGYGDNPTWGQVYGGHVGMLVASQELPGAVPPAVLTIASGVITPTTAGVIVDTEGGAAADDLTTISGVTLHDGAWLLLRAADVSRVVTVKHGMGVGSISLDGEVDVDLSPDGVLVLRRDGDLWREVRMLRARSAETLDGVLGISNGGTGATDAAGARTNLGWLSASRDMQAGTVRFWPSLTVPVLDDGLPLGLPLDGAVVSLATYPRLSRVLCPEGDNAWAPNWYRCTAGGVRDVAGGYIKLDDWRGGYPQVLDAGAGRAKSTVLVSTTNSSANITIVNNLSGGGTLVAPYTGSDGIYPGLEISGNGIPSGATVVSVSETTVMLSAACTATGSSVEATVTGRVLGGWQGDAGRPLEGTFASAELSGSSVATGAFYLAGDALRANSGYISGGRLYGFRSALAVPTAPTGRPAGPVANAIILV